MKRKSDYVHHLEWILGYCRLRKHPYISTEDRYMINEFGHAFKLKYEVFKHRTEEFFKTFRSVLIQMVEERYLDQPIKINLLSGEYFYRYPLTHKAYDYKLKISKIVKRDTRQQWQQKYNQKGSIYRK